MDTSSSSNVTKRTSKSSSTATSVNAMVEEKLSPIVEKIMPVINVLTNALNATWPYVQKAIAFVEEVQKKLEPYHPEELVNVFFGLFLVFFGGMYLTLLATVEAYRMCGWSQTKQYLLDLYADYIVVRDASRKDDLVDENNDGIADVNQISKKELPP